MFLFVLKYVRKWSCLRMASNLKQCSDNSIPKPMPMRKDTPKQIHFLDGFNKRRNGSGISRNMHIFFQIQKIQALILKPCWDNSISSPIPNDFETFPNRHVPLQIPKRKVTRFVAGGYDFATKIWFPIGNFESRETAKKRKTHEFACPPTPAHGASAIEGRAQGQGIGEKLFPMLAKWDQFWHCLLRFCCRRPRDGKLAAPWGLPGRSPTPVLTGPCAA